jgi:hypothetical protein
LLFSNFGEREEERGKKEREKEKERTRKRQIEKGRTAFEIKFIGMRFSSRQGI